MLGIQLLILYPSHLPILKKYCKPNACSSGLLCCCWFQSSQLHFTFSKAYISLETLFALWLNECHLHHKAKLTLVFSLASLSQNENKGNFYGIFSTRLSDESRRSKRQQSSYGGGRVEKHPFFRFTVGLL